MGIRLDWEIESDQRSIKGSGEDPNRKRARRGALLRLLILVGILLGAVAVVGYLIYDRLNEVDAEIERILRDTVESEVAALRISDRSAFLQYQWEGSDAWLDVQQATFEDYEQRLRENPNFQLTGNILDVTIDDPRARVEVQEIESGVPYTRLWFYYRFEQDTDEDGLADVWQWYHVPQDTTFWGESTTIETDRVLLRYNEFDQPLAEPLAQQIDGWITTACETIDCAGLPQITVDIETEDLNSRIQWSDSAIWRLEVLSPYTDRMRTDMPFSPALRSAAATLVAERLTMYAAGFPTVAPNTAADYFINTAIPSWMVGRFLQANTGADLVESLIQNYGPDALSQLLRTLQTDPRISALSQVGGLPLDQVNLNWRDFFQWRLEREGALIAAQNTNAVLELYDTRDQVVTDAMYARLNQPQPVEPIQVTSVTPTAPSPTGEAQFNVNARIGQADAASEVMVTFRLVDGVWKRAS